MKDSELAGRRKSGSELRLYDCGPQAAAGIKRLRAVNDICGP